MVIKLVKSISFLSISAMLCTNIFYGNELKDPEKNQKDSKIFQKESKKKPKLANPSLIKKFSVSNSEKMTIAEHSSINMFTGTFSGAVFGSLSGLSLYDSSKYKPEASIYLFGGIFGAVGLLTGLLTTYLEYRKGIQFDIGKPILNYTWLGTIGGALLGALVGLIPYSSSNKTDDILRFSGYGSMFGLLTGTILYFFRPSTKEVHKIDFYSSYNSSKEEWVFGLSKIF